jgi:hypothetical protein
MVLSLKELGLHKLCLIAQLLNYLVRFIIDRLIISRISIYIAIYMLLHVPTHNKI